MLKTNIGTGKSCIKSLYALLLFLFFVAACKNAAIVQQADRLPGSTPEAEGVSSQGILDFLQAVENSEHELHSFMFLRHGKVIAEGWWNPYSPNLKHTMYSLSKSFTSTAVGFAVSEKLLSVDDPVISFFPEDLPDSVSPFLADMKVKDLLAMSAGQAPDPTATIVANDSNWVQAFLATPVVHDPGTKFLYNSMATYMLSAIVQKQTGKTMLEYLKPRLFEPLGIEGMDWEVDPVGINTGGWGLRIKTEDMARFGQLYLQKGRWNDRPVLPAPWIEEATTSKIIQYPELSPAARDSNDWAQGYCYQFWRCRNNAYRGDGAFGQYIIVMPDQDAVVVMTSETYDMQGELNLVWDHLLPAIKEDALPEDKELSARLEQRLNTLALPLSRNETDHIAGSSVSEKTYVMEPNKRMIDTLLFQFHADTCHLIMKSNHDDYTLTFGTDKWMIGETSRRGPNLLFGAKAHFEGLSDPIIAGNYAWKDSNSVELILRYIESPHREIINCSFDQDHIQIRIRQSNTPSQEPDLLEGKVIDWK
ncbi:MAG: serine hydrolase [Prolixibacteraceae bacterium]